MLLALLLESATLLAQEQPTDSINAATLSEVIVIGKKNQLHEKQAKPLATVDDFLQKSGKIGMVRRGSYAWEPIINGMATERTVITIDGMRIFGACTDKMDPITSYVEVSNLSEATVTSGQQGGCHGATIGGSVDLKRTCCDLEEKPLSTTINTGFETNSRQKILGAALTYSDSLYSFAADFMSRNADNYTAGKGREIQFSQFSKFNISASSAVRLARTKVLEASVIYDKATDVGYPALPMDVSLAEALITSLRLDYRPVDSKVTDWESKIYFNTITHRMDDTKRPDVAIHMDMPGWSDTFGFYSKFTGSHKKHNFSVDLNSYYNRSRAEMTMYPTDPEESPMFMETWPDVGTFDMALFLEDKISVGNYQQLRFSASVANHYNRIGSTQGLESLQIFYPGIAATNNRVLKSISGNYNYERNGLNLNFGLAYGERAPSVSEGYGFYLFNSFDRYDYVGNPQLKNEKSEEASVSIGYKTEKFSVKGSGSWFHILDYIVAKPDEALIPMTIGASGVKVVGALNYADIMNAILDAEYRLTTNLTTKAQLVYSRGFDENNVGLPFISPLRYSGAVNYKKRRFSAEVVVEGNAVQDEFSPTYGEDRTPAYAILGLSSGYSYSIGRSKYVLKAGVENLLDAYYSTYSDWNDIPRKGRNFFVNLVVSFD
ncbi:MAG: TonB-dependent receptor [Flavobacterium sp.]|nr:MAG: TonB-dependent receptor [Flavobacterium sp.]